MATLNEKFNGLGNTLYTALPEDIADANKALARALGQIKNVFQRPNKPFKSKYIAMKLCN